MDSVATVLKMESATLSSCYADPNFAVICGFFEKFGKMCGVEFPLASELVMMLECEEGVPEQLAFLHTQLLRKIRRSTTIEKWERTALKFCQTHLKEDAVEFDKRGYLGCSMELKLRLLRTLLETQFDFNTKFKAAVNLLTAEELRQKPIGKDLSGRLYWGHLDAGANLKVFREEPEEDGGGWTVVAEDRPTLVKLLQELTGDDSLDLSPIVEPVAPVVDTGQNSSASDEEDEENGALSEGTTEGDDETDDTETSAVAKRSLEAPEETKNKKLKTSDECSESIEEPVLKVEGVGSGAECNADNQFKPEFSEAVEEPVFYVRGAGSGAECDAGNPEREGGPDAEVSTSSQQTANDLVSTSEPEAMPPPDSVGGSSADADSTTVVSSSAPTEDNIDSTSTGQTFREATEEIESTDREVSEAVTTSSLTNPNEEVSTSREVLREAAEVGSNEEFELGEPSSSDELCHRPAPEEPCSSESPEEINVAISASSFWAPQPDEENQVGSSGAVGDDSNEPSLSRDHVGCSGSHSTEADDGKAAQMGRHPRLWSIQDICGTPEPEASSSEFARAPVESYSSFAVDNVVDKNTGEHCSTESSQIEPVPLEAPVETKSDESLTSEAVSSQYALEVSDILENTPEEVDEPSGHGDSLDGSPKNWEATLKNRKTSENATSETGEAESELQYKQNHNSNALTVPAIIITPTTPEPALSPSNESSSPKIEALLSGKNDSPTKETSVLNSELAEYSKDEIINSSEVERKKSPSPTAPAEIFLSETVKATAEQSNNAGGTLAAPPSSKPPLSVVAQDGITEGDKEEGRGDDAKNISENILIDSFEKLETDSKKLDNGSDDAGVIEPSSTDVAVSESADLPTQEPVSTESPVPQSLDSVLTSVTEIDESLGFPPKPDLDSNQYLPSNEVLNEKNDLPQDEVVAAVALPLLEDSLPSEESPECEKPLLMSLRSEEPPPVSIADDTTELSEVNLTKIKDAETAIAHEKVTKSLNPDVEDAKIRLESESDPVAAQDDKDVFGAVAVHHSASKEESKSPVEPTQAESVETENDPVIAETEKDDFNLKQTLSLLTYAETRSGHLSAVVNPGANTPSDISKLETMVNDFKKDNPTECLVEKKPILHPLETISKSEVGYVIAEKRELISTSKKYRDSEKCDGPLGAEPPCEDDDKNVTVVNSAETLDIPECLEKTNSKLEITSELLEPGDNIQLPTKALTGVKDNRPCEESKNEVAIPDQKELKEEIVGVSTGTSLEQDKNSAVLLFENQEVVVSPTSSKNLPADDLTADVSETNKCHEIIKEIKETPDLEEKREMSEEKSLEEKSTGRKRRRRSSAAIAPLQKTLRSRRRATDPELNLEKESPEVQLTNKEDPLGLVEDQKEGNAEEADPLATPVSPGKGEIQGSVGDLDPLALGGDTSAPELGSTKPKLGRKKRKRRGPKPGTKKKDAANDPAHGTSSDEGNKAQEEEDKTEQVEEVEAEKSTKKKGREKKNTEVKDPNKKPGAYYIPAREIQLLGVAANSIQDDSPSTVRQSRRIAQIRMKEDAERRRQEEFELLSFKKGKKKENAGEDKKKKGSKKAKDLDYEEEEEGEESEDKGKVKKEKKFHFDDKNPWQSSSGSSSQEEEIEEDEIEEEPEEPAYKSDHEFSPESDLEDPEYQPVRVARTAHGRSDAPQGRYDDVACEVCGKSDRPEWILLCDGCDKGSHTECLKPPLHLVPEGEWFCPPCSLQTLIAALKKTLRDYDRCEKQRENEELRKKRLAFVGISLDNVLPSRKPKKLEHKESESESASESGSSSGETSDSGPVYQLRERRSNVASYRYNEYDELIKSAIREELGEDAPIEQTKEVKEGTPERVKSPINGAQDEVNNVEEKNKEGSEADVDKAEDADYVGDTDEDALDEIPAVVPRKRQQKKKKISLTNLEFTSEEEDHNSDSDFKGSSEEEDEEDDDMSDDLSGEQRGRGRRGAKRAAVRRSTRARRRRYDKDFINDDTSNDSEEPPPRRRDLGSSESSDSDRSWGRKATGKRSRRRRAPSPLPKHKKKHKKRKKHSDESEAEEKPKKRRVKYGLDSDSDDKVVNRRTRGRQINYVVDNDASDSEEEAKKKKKGKDDSAESDVEFNAEDEKLEDEEDEEDQEDELNEDSVEESEDEPPVVKKQKTEKKTPARDKSIKKGKPGRKKGLGKKKKPLSDSESDIEDDLEDLDDEAEEKLLGMLEEGDIPVEQLKAAVKRTKEERKSKAAAPEVEVKAKKSKVKITPTRAEIAEKAAAAKARKAGGDGGLLMRNLQASQSPVKTTDAPMEPVVVSPARQGRPAFPSQIQGPFSRPLLQGAMPPQHPQLPQMLRGGPQMLSGPLNPLMRMPHSNQSGTPPPPHMMPHHPHHMQMPPQGGTLRQMMPQQMHQHGSMGGPLHPMGPQPQHHPGAPRLPMPSHPPMPHQAGIPYPPQNTPQMVPVAHPQMAPHPTTQMQQGSIRPPVGEHTGSSQSIAPPQAVGPHSNLPSQQPGGPLINMPHQQQGSPHPQQGGPHSSILPQQGNLHTNMPPQQGGPLSNMSPLQGGPQSNMPPQGPPHPGIPPQQPGGPHSNLPPSQVGIHPQIGQKPPPAAPSTGPPPHMQMGSPSKAGMPMGGQFPPHSGPYPVQGSYPNPNPNTSPNFQQSPETAKQRRKPGPKPGSKNKKKTEDDTQVAAAAAKGRPRGRKCEDVTIATVQAPTQFPDAGSAEGGSVITRMLNSTQVAGSAAEPDSRFQGSPTPSGSAMYHPARPLDPSPSGGAAVTVAKPPFPPEGFPPYQNFQQHFPGFPGAAFPTTQQPSVPPGPQAPSPALTGPAAPVPAPLIPGKQFEEEEAGEFGGLASYFASQAEEDMDT